MLGAGLAVLGSACDSDALPLLRAGKGSGSGSGLPPAGGSSNGPAPAPANKGPSVAEKLADDLTPTPFKVLGVVADVGGSRLSNPVGVAVDPMGILYVVDAGAKRVVKIGADGRMIAAWTTPEGGTAFEAPHDIATGPGGNIYVLDRAAGVVFGVSPDGKQIGRWGSDGPGFYNPSGLAASAAGYFVADTGTGRIVRFDGNGKRQGDLGPRSGGGSELKEPTGAIADADGGIWAVDGGAAALVRFSKDGQKEISFESTARAPARGTQLPDGSLLISDPLRGRLLRFDKQGKLLARYGEQGSEEGKFQLPTGLTADAQGNVYVADSQNNRVVKVQLQ
jgi:sugar lactone lactonase YvrE